MNLESIANELKTIRKLFDEADFRDVSATVQKYAIILCLFDVIMRRVEQERDPKNFNEMFDGTGLSLMYFKEKLGLFVEHFGRYVHGHPDQVDWLGSAEDNLKKVFHQLAPFE
jgi:hypothetical protein